MAVCALIGAAVMVSVDEIVFHQILGRHHFYDRSTSGVGLLSDGPLHTAELLALVAGFFLYADLRPPQGPGVGPRVFGLLPGWGSSSCSTGSWTTSCCACIRSATTWTSLRTTGHGTSPVWSCCSSA
jgi:hypothetical protein